MMPDDPRAHAGDSPDMKRWSGVSEAYRRSFSTLCAGAIPHLLAHVGAGHLLDVGCGTGDLLMSAADRCQVVGVDADSEMVSWSGMRHPGRVVQAALPALPFPDGSFDIVVSNFVVNHVPDPQASVRELARVTRPGGSIAATIWPSGRSVWAELVNGCFEAAGAVPKPSPRLPKELDFARSVEGLASLIASAGARVEVADEVAWEWRITPDALWAGISGGVATAGETFLAQSPDVQRRIESEFRARSEVAATRGVLSFPSRAVMVIGGV